MFLLMLLLQLLLLLLLMLICLFVDWSLFAVRKWRQDLKNLLRKCGEQGDQTVFFLSDYQIKDEGFLSDMNIILNTAYLSSLFEQEEIREIIQNVCSVPSIFIQSQIDA